MMDTVPGPFLCPALQKLPVPWVLSREVSVRQAVSGDTPVYCLGNDQGVLFFFEIFYFTQTRMGLWGDPGQCPDCESGLWKWHLPVWVLCLC